MMRSGLFALEKPVISVVVEGYNESLTFEAVDVMEGLQKQRFSLDRVEVVLIGSAAQVARWREVYGAGSPFYRVEMVEAEGAYYFELKNKGASVASADIVALTDCDVYPEPSWLSTIVEGVEAGADVVTGVSLFRSRGGRGSDHPLLQVAASITWAPLLEGRTNGGSMCARGFQAHNVAFRSSILRSHPFRTDLHQKVAGVFLPAALHRSGIEIMLQPEQRVAHSITPGWWLRLHMRFGYELHLLRRQEESWPHRWVRKTWLLEPPLTASWHAAMDGSRWFSYGRLIGAGRARRWVLLPVVLGMSAVARSAEMIGMYGAILSPERMARFAASV